MYAGSLWQKTGGGVTLSRVSVVAGLAWSGPVYVSSYVPVVTVVTVVGGERERAAVRHS